MKSKQQDFRTERYLRYSIRKYSFGVASVVVVAGLLFFGNGVASASEQQLKETASSTELVVANSPGSAIFEATDSSVVTAKEEKGEEIQIEEAAHKEAAHTEEDVHTEEFKREEVISQDDTSTGKQGQAQTSISGIERFSRLHDPDVLSSYYSLSGASDGKVTVERVGTYSIDSTTGIVTFSPLPSFTGTPEGVTVQAGVVGFDVEGNLTHGFYEGHYRPTVTPVVPEGTSVTSKGLQGVVQEGTPVFTAGDDTAPITITQEQPAQFVVDGVAISAKEIPATQSGKEIGTYQIDPSTGRVTFQPHHEFLGTPDPARVQVKDQNGTPATATYTPSVYGLDAKDDTSTGKQGQVQTSISGIERFSRLHDPDVHLSYYSLNGSSDGKVTVERVGTYSIDSTTGTVTFRPLPSFTGTPEGVTVRAVVTEPDIEGNLTQSAYEAHYRPTVTPVVPVAPVSPVPPFTSVTPTPPVAPASPATPVTSVTPTPPVAPVSPATPVTSVTPTPPATPVSPVAPEIPMTPPIESGEKEDIQGKEQTGKTSIKLPNTGTKEYTSLVSFGLFGVMSLVYLITRKRKKE